MDIDVDIQFGISGPILRKIQELVFTSFAYSSILSYHACFCLLMEVIKARIRGKYYFSNFVKVSRKLSDSSTNFITK